MGAVARSTSTHGSRRAEDLNRRSFGRLPDLVVVFVVVVVVALLLLLVVLLQGLVASDAAIVALVAVST